MQLQNFYRDLPAIWLVFAGSYLEHENAPYTSPDQREKSLVDLLRHYLQTELVNPSMLEQYGKHALTQLTTVLKLLDLWSQDLELIYQIRQSGANYSQAAQVAQRFLRRIREFENCTIIPNGLIAAKHTDKNENVSLAILKKHASGIDWIQIDPGSVYHQRCQSLAGEKSSAYLVITEINPTAITEDWLLLLVGLKAIDPSGYYKDVALYECLLAQLNGSTTFKSEYDESFVLFSHTSPTHTWQVVDQSLRYLLQHFIGDTYTTIYWQLIIGFKQFLLKQTYDAYQQVANEQKQQCHYLLQEMFQHIAQLTLEHGDQKQIKSSAILIDSIKALIDRQLKQQYQQACANGKLDEPYIASLSFAPPTIADYAGHSNRLKASNIQTAPLFVPPAKDEDIIDYLEQLNSNFIAKLINSDQIKDVALLSYGIEVFIIDYLANTTILEKSKSPFSKNDIYLANVLNELAEIYYGCQGRMVKHFLSGMTYQPQFYAKNLTIQFFVYAAVAALNLRDNNIRSLLEQYNLSTAASSNLDFNAMLTHLVIDDPRWLKTLFAIKEFFKPVSYKETLYSYHKFDSYNFRFEIQNNAEEHDLEVKFAYNLLKKDSLSYQRFTTKYRYLEDENLNQKWQVLTYSNEYLPSLYCLLTKIALIAKTALTGFPANANTNRITANWDCRQTREYYSLRCYWKSTVSFEINYYEVKTQPDVDQFSGYVLNKIKPGTRYFIEDPYQRLIIRKNNLGKANSHFSENEITASQHEKPVAIDRIHYMQLGFIQSNPPLKLERLYIAIKQRQLDFTCEQDSTLIKQTLFETSSLYEIEARSCSLLEWTVHHNPQLIHQLGLLCVEKALAMKLRLTQHQAIGEILEVVLGLLAFYPPTFKNEFIESISSIYTLLTDVLAKPPEHLAKNTLLYLNAYLIISAQAKPTLTSAETLTILIALLEIQNLKVDGFTLANNMLLRVHLASFKLSPLIEQQLDLHQTILNDLMVKVTHQWQQTSEWQRSDAGFLYSCNDHSIEPLSGRIYFRNKPITGLPDKITEHKVFKDYFGDLSFAVKPYSRMLSTNEVPCYLSIDRSPIVRLTLIDNDLLIEELIEKDYQLYIPAQQLLNSAQHPNLLYQSPKNGDKFRHWLANGKILIKNQQRQIIYQWDLPQTSILSLQHQGKIVAFEQLKNTNFKAFIQRIELPGWIEIIADKSTDNATITLQSLHFPRLGLNFDYKQGKFFCRQIHSYYLAEQQNLNTLSGFSNYLVLEKNERGSTLKQIKVIIPHRKLIKTRHFYLNTTTANLDIIQDPSYFVFDLDQRLGLLKANSISAQLYLALLYYCSAALDDYDLSGCNAYHLARENLEICWKDKPYDNTELDIIECLLNQEAMHNLHHNHIAIYLKVISLLSCSLRLSFLYTDETAVHNKERSKKLLEDCSQRLPALFALYMRHKSNIFTRIKLTMEEEQDLMEYALQGKHEYIQQFQAYNRLYFEQQPKVSLFSQPKKNYKEHYQKLFSRDQLHKTSFVALLNEHIDVIKFDSSKQNLNFSGAIDAILVKRFRLEHFIPLYKLAKSAISLTKYRYLLHHMVLRAKILEDKFPPALVMMLARALLIVAENPGQFPKAPNWFDTDNLQFDLSERSLTKYKVCEDFPRVSYSSYNYKYYEQALKNDQLENSRIWANLKKYSLDSNKIPRNLPNDQNDFILDYEHYVNFSNTSKKKIVRRVYLQAARNDAMYRFLVTILQQCDTLKYTSAMGWTIAPCINQSISLTVMADKQQTPRQIESPNLEKWAVSQQPLIELKQFFILKQRALKTTDFPLESQLKGPRNGYQQQFYSELKASWLAYHKEVKSSYDWSHEKSVKQLEQYLQTQQAKISEQAEQFWHKITEQFKRRLNSESEQQYSLRWYSGQALYYHKGDLLTLLLTPNKLANYNPMLISQQDSLTQNLLSYVVHEINKAKITRALALIEQYKQAKNESEKFSLLQRIVSSLQETIDQASYRYPHWLLFQLENNLIVRSNQHELILAMLGQTKKSMYQLNMGEGKSSVILPLLSYDLANGRQILRINVLQPLLATMKDLLRQRFSGLIKKRVYTLPFYRDTDISTANLKLFLQVLKDCQHNHHILLVTPEHRMCLQLKIRELMLENQQQINADGIFNWQTYRQRARHKAEAYQNLTAEQTKQLLAEQDQRLKKCLVNEKYIDNTDRILQVPPRGQGSKAFAKFKDAINEPTFREWSCLKAAYCELLFNSQLAYSDSSEKLALLNEANELTTIDLLDESDEILKHGTELNYTIGDKRPFAGNELRWQVPQFFIEQIFCDNDLKQIITAGKSRGFTELNLKYNAHGGVPYIQLLNEDYCEKRSKFLLIEKFFTFYLSTFREYQIKLDVPLIKGEKSSLREYLSGQLSSGIEKKIIAFLADKGHLKDIVLIAKGWLSHGILFHVFNAKYRVKYGLDIHLSGQMRKQIAIPFSGKDSPSLRSEFSHPDVMLGFSIISYLYQGLSKQQLKQTLLKLKDKFSYQVADKHLSDWVEANRGWLESQTKEFPQGLTSFANLDLADEQCLAKVHLYLAYSHHAILFYLNHFVLPGEALQYLYKMSANAHSLVGYNPALGFSGTDDRKITMPFQIESLRSESQQGTNGKLLYILTRKRNSSYHSLEISDSTDLLKQLCNYVEKKSNCYMLIDAGALVTGLTNYQVALFLIDNLPNKFLGIIYFSDEGNNLTVLMRDKKIIALQDCHINQQYLFAYLDDIHTRGTDIQMPLDCHGILTIGMGMQKDKLMQAAMRLRQLAQKQSVSLWGTREVTLAIAENNQINAAAINSLEVIKWVTLNTVKQINADLFPVALRKINFQFLQKAEVLLKEAPTTINTLMKYCQEKELFALEDFYGLSPQLEDLGDRLYSIVAEQIKQFWQELQQELDAKQLKNTEFYANIFNPDTKQAFRDQLHTICREVEIYLQQGYVQNALDNDQEKEVEVEIIQEQNVIVKIEEKKSYTETNWDVKLILHQDFIKLAQQKNIIMPIKAISRHVQLSPQLKNIIWHHDIYMTANFVNTVELNSSETLDNYLRLVDVVLIHRLADKSICVLLSGQEAAQIKTICFQQFNNNLLLVHLNDINGPTILPVNSRVSKQELKLLTIINLFAGECHYVTAKEIQRLAKRVGRIYPDYFINQAASIDSHCSQKLYSILIEQEYLDFSGVMTAKLFKVFDKIKVGESPTLELTNEFHQHNQFILKKLYSTYNKLIIQPVDSLKANHYTLWQWVGTRGKQKDLPGSELESVLNSEHQLKL